MSKWLHRLVVSIFVLTTMIALVASLNEVYFSHTGNRLISNEEIELVLFHDGVGFHISTNGRSIVLMRITEIRRTLDQIKSPRAALYPDTGYAYFEIPTDSMPNPDTRVIDCAAFHVVAIEYWFIAICSAIYPIVFFIRSYRRRRVRREVLQPCTQCGYDLQGNQSGVCPECGRAREATV